MSLLEANKNARRARILSAARQLLEEHGYAGVTMRALADASQVSVPTLYNLFGGREPLLLAAVEEGFGDVLESKADLSGTVDVDSVFNLFAGINTQLTESPRYARTMIQVFMGSSGTRTTSMRMAKSMGERLAHLMMRLKQAGVISDWIEPLALSQRIGSHYLSSVIGWAATRQSADVLRATTEYELCLTLMGAVSHKRDRERLEARLSVCQPAVTRSIMELIQRKPSKKKARSR